MTMTKKQAIKYYLEHMHDDDLINLINGIHSYSGDYDLYVFYHMDEFNELHEGCTPMEIAEEIIYAHGDFNVVDDYFHYDYAGCLSSCDEPTAADLIRTNCMEDLVNDFMNMRNCEPVADCDGDLWDIITADDNAVFDSKGYEILK